MPNRQTDASGFGLSSTSKMSASISTSVPIYLARDDGSAEGAEAIAEIGRFTRDYWGNGKLRIINADTGALISRKDAFIPVNCWLDVNAANARIDEWRKRAQERRLLTAESAN
jgi:hypothetical protein